MRHFIFIFILFFPISASADTNFTFATNWVAQPEHGGFYQALSDGEYKKCGLDLEIIQGGPGSNNRAKLITNKIDVNPILILIIQLSVLWNALYFAQRVAINYGNNI